MYDKDKDYDFKNFYTNTVADWSRCEVPETPPDFVSFSGSAYWDYGDRVRRWSDHWGDVASCIWYLEGQKVKSMLCGECYYEDFRNTLCLLDLTSQIQASNV